MNNSFKELYDKYKVHDENNVKGFFDSFRFLSNFHICDVWFEGLLYPSSEHAYMASKTLNEQVRLKFSKEPPHTGNETSLFDGEFSPLLYDPVLTASEARKFGQTIELRPNWDNIKYHIMLAIVFDKFWRNKDIQQKLLDTGNKYLEETNHWKDEFYGVNAWTGVGQNNLGKILMKVRDILRK